MKLKDEWNLNSLTQIPSNTSFDMSSIPSLKQLSTFQFTNFINISKSILNAAVDINEEQDNKDMKLLCETKTKQAPYCDYLLRLCI